MFFRMSVMPYWNWRKECVERKRHTEVPETNIRMIEFCPGFVLEAPRVCVNPFGAYPENGNDRR